MGGCIQKTQDKIDIKTRDNHGVAYKYIRDLERVQRKALNKKSIYEGLASEVEALKSEIEELKALKENNKSLSTLRRTKTSYYKS